MKRLALPLLALLLLVKLAGCSSETGPTVSTEEQNLTPEVEAAKAKAEANAGEKPKRGAAPIAPY